jgi:hypothetical protein
MFLMRITLFLSFGLILVYCKTTEDKVEIKIGQSIQPNEFESDIQEKREADKPKIGENNSNGEFKLKGKPNSADLWKESLLSYMDLNRSPRGTCSGNCRTSLQCVLRSGDVNCMCSLFSCTYL